MKKAVFFDIDGTLWNYQMQIPESTVWAIRKLRSPDQERPSRVAQHTVAGVVDHAADERDALGGIQLLVFHSDVFLRPFHVVSVVSVCYPPFVRIAPYLPSERVAGTREPDENRCGELQQVVVGVGIEPRVPGNTEADRYYGA